MSNTTQTGMSLVSIPPALPPKVGLIPTVQGTPYLFDDEYIDVIQEGLSQLHQRWETGYAYSPEQTQTDGLVDDPCNMAAMVIPGNPAWVEVQPGIVWAGDHCSTFGWEARDFIGRATRALLASESKHAAREFWTGRQAQASGWPNTYLASTAAEVISATPLTPSLALALLEEGLAQTTNGGPGAIHCTRQCASSFSELGNTFRQMDGTIVTWMGTVIIPDAGYSGTSPNGTPPTSGSQYAYATLMPTVRRSQIVIEPAPEDLAAALDRRTNFIEWRAWRAIGVEVPPLGGLGWPVLACAVNLPLSPAGS